jgi:hypothetical protein
MFRIKLAAASAALMGLLAATAGHASATYGAVYLSYGSQTVPSGALPATADANFTPGAIDYNPSDDSSVYTLGAFLNNPAFTNESAQFIAAGGANASLGYGSGTTLIDIQGTLGLLNGDNSFVVGHDDGVILTINGSTVVNEPGPTSLDTTPFTVTNAGPTGNYAFDLRYIETSGPPASLVFTINDVPVGVPEPATWSMMILGLGAIGATLRRRARVATLAA